jgi:hypothetical protein
MIKNHNLGSIYRSRHHKKKSTIDNYSLPEDLLKSYTNLIENSWKQYEITLIKIPEQYFNKAKQYLWIVSLFLAIKIQFIMKYVVGNDIVFGFDITSVFYILFALSIAFDILCFVFGIRFLNADSMIKMPLSSPYDTLRENYQSSYKLLCGIIGEIHFGLEGAKERLKLAGENLNKLSMIIYFSVAFTVFLIIAFLVHENFT